MAGERGARAYLVATIAAALLGVTLRLAVQVGYNYDVDELFTLFLAVEPLPRVVAASLQDQTHPPLHNLLMHLWIKVAGTSEFALRVPSVAASAAFLLTLSRLVLRWMPPAAGLLVVLLCAVSPIFVFYGQQARPYALVACFAALSVFLLMKIQEGPAARWKILYGLSCAGLMYSQYMGVFLLLPQFAAITLWPFRDRRLTLGCGLAGMLSIAPWVAMVGTRFHPAELPIQWIERPGWRHLPALYTDVFNRVPGISWILLLLIAAVLSSLVWRWRNADRPVILIVAALALCGPMCAWLLSMFGPVSLWAARQLLGPAIFFTCLVGIAIGLHRRWVGAALGCVLVGWTSASLVAAPSYFDPPWRTIARFLDDAARGDVVGQEPWVVQPIRFYSARGRIYEFKDYTDRLGQVEEMVYVCRLPWCQGLEQLVADRYQPTRTKVFHWGSGEPTPGGGIRVYFLERRADGGQAQR